MLQPKRTKYRKQQKGRNSGISYKGHTVDFGSFGLKAITNGRITNRQIEAARIAMTRYMKREGKPLVSMLIDNREENLDALRWLVDENVKEGHFYWSKSRVIWLVQFPRVHPIGVLFV